MLIVRLGFAMSSVFNLCRRKRWLMFQVADGTLVNNEARPCVPPLGKEIKTALECLVPTKGAVATGQRVEEQTANGRNEDAVQANTER
jgi:hypothetical protein